MKKILSLFLFLSVYCSAQWIPTNGPFGGNAFCLLYKNNTLFAGTDCGVFVTANDGEVWERRANGLTDCTPVKALIEFNNTILAGTNNGVYLTNDNGINWISSSAGLTNLDIFCFFVNGQDILLSTQAGVYKSTNGGASWASSSIGIPGNAGAFTSFAKSGSTIFATNSLGIFKSNDNGFSWSLTNSGLPQISLNSYSVSNITAVNSTLFVITNDGLYLSTDNGVSWAQSTSNLPLNCGNLYYSGTSLYVNAGTGIYKSTTNGNNWNQISTLFASRFLYANNRLYTSFIGTSQNESNGVYKATNNESVWTNIGLGRSGSANDILKDGNYLYCATNNGFYFSNDQGNTWRLRSGGLNVNTVVTCVTKLGSNIFIGTEKNGVYKSSDLGLNWIQVVNGLTESSLTFYEIMAIESVGNELYIGARRNNTYVRIYKSIDNGTNWINVTNNLDINTLYVYDIHSIGNVIYLATDIGTYLTTSQGTSWVSSNFGMPINDILALESNSTSLFAAHYDATSSTQPPYGGVFVSQDFGSSWGNNNFSTNKTVYSLFAINNMIFAGSLYPYISIDNGNSWLLAGNGLPVAPINDIHGDNNGVFAAMSYGSGYDASRGVYKYGGAVGLNELPLINSNELYPNPFTNYLEIKNISLNQILKYEILDNSSRVIQNGELVSNRIENLENLSNGIYYLKIIDKDKISLHKIIK